MKRLVSLLLAALMLASLTACGGSPGASGGSQAGDGNSSQGDKTVYTLKFGHDANEDSTYQAGAEALKRIVEEKSEGRLQIEIYNSGSLGSETELLESVRMGVTDMCFATAANSSATFPQMGIFSVSFLFDDQAHFDRCLEPGSDLTNALKKIVADANVGCSLAGCISQGLRSVEAKVPVRTPEDLKGVSMRVMNSETEILVWSTIGTLPTSIATGECYSALQTGVITALENSPAILNSWKFYEVAPYVCLTEHEYLISGLYVSDKVREKLPEDLYSLLLECVDEAAAETLEFDKENDQKALQELEENGATIIKDVDKAAFASLVMPLRDQVAEQLGVQDLVSIIDAAKA